MNFADSAQLIDEVLTAGTERELVIEQLASLKIRARTAQGRDEILTNLPNLWENVRKLGLVYLLPVLELVANLVADDADGSRRLAALSSGVLTFIVTALTNGDDSKAAMVASIVLSNFAVQHPIEDKSETTLEIENQFRKADVLGTLFRLASSSQTKLPLRLVYLRTCNKLIPMKSVRDSWVESIGVEGVVEVFATGFQEASDKLASGFVRSFSRFFINEDSANTVASYSLADIEQSKGNVIFGKVCDQLETTNKALESLSEAAKDELMSLINAVVKRTPLSNRLVDLKMSIAMSQSAQIQQQSGTGKAPEISKEQETELLELTHVAEADIAKRVEMVMKIPQTLELIISYVREYVSPIKESSHSLQKHPPGQALQHSVETLAIICDQSNTVKELMFERGWHKLVVHGIVRTSSLIAKEMEATKLDRIFVEQNANVRMSCLHALTHLSLSTEHCVQLASMPELVSALTSILDTMGAFDYEGVRRAALVTKNLSLESSTRERFVGSGIGNALLKIIPSRDYNSGLVAAGALRLFLNTYEERFLLEVASESSVTLVLSLDIKTTHPHIRVEAARYLCGVLHISGDRAISEASDDEASSEELPLPSILSADADVTATLAIYKLVDSVPAIQFMVFLLASADPVLHSEVLLALLRCSDSTLKQLPDVIHLDGTPILPLVARLANGEEVDEGVKKRVAQLSAQLLERCAKLDISV